ncbi:MAG: hypothetical protein M9962_12960 [Oligoflexia bacterium]|nr:hypothetical protein [Oligoflexia bacterium]
MASKEEIYYFKEGKFHFFCPLCHYHQSTNTIQKINIKHYLQIAVVTAAFALVCWPIFGMKGVFSYLFFLFLFEVFYRFRKRQALVCESCGFDPFLYKVNPKKARDSLRAYWQERIDKENLFQGKKLKNYKTKLLSPDMEQSENFSAPPSSDSEKMGSEATSS